MSASVGSNEARAAWIALIHDCLARLREVYPFENTISSENLFRENFYELPHDLNGPNTDRNYNNFNRSHGQMLTIIRGLDRALQLKSPESLNDVFWTHTLAALQVCSTQTPRPYYRSDWDSLPWKIMAFVTQISPMCTSS